MARHPFADTATLILRMLSTPRKLGSASLPPPPSPSPFSPPDKGGEYESRRERRCGPRYFHAA